MQTTPLVTRIERVEPAGWSLNMILVRLPGGGVLVHSPTWLGAETFERVDAIGTPRILFAPNHFHHKSLRRFRERYPDALVVASEAALPRLRKQGYSGIEELAAADALLPPGARWLRCQGTKNGEAWLSLAEEHGRTWIACDAFFHMHRPVTGVTGVMLRALQIIPGLRVGRTFDWVGVRDKRAYCAWAEAALREESPSGLFVSHGEPIQSADLPERLLSAIRARF